VHSGASTTQNIDALFFMLGWTSTDSRKNTLGHVTVNLCFPSGVICGSRSAFWCVWGMKHRHTFFHAVVGPVRFTQKLTRTHYTELAFLHLAGSAGHIV
jgi:hypothetical protein